MATEKATDTTTTQNPAPKAPAKARATRAQTSSAAPDAASTTATVAPKKPRSRPSRSAKAAEPAGAEKSEAAAVEKLLLESEASKSLQSRSGPLAPKPACKAHCGQCGREMRFVPFALSNLMCRSCYGLDRYRRPTAPSLSSLTATRPSGPR